MTAGSPDFATATTDQFIIPLTFALTSCTGDEVQVSTELHGKVHTTEQPDGSFNSEVEFNTQSTQAQALLTGAKYGVEDEMNESLQDIPPGTTNTVKHSFHMIRAGESGLLPDDDFMLHFLLHFTVNANGTMTVDNFDERAECM